MGAGIKPFIKSIRLSLAKLVPVKREGAHSFCTHIHRFNIHGTDWGRGWRGEARGVSANFIHTAWIHALHRHTAACLFCLKPPTCTTRRLAVAAYEWRVPSHIKCSPHMIPYGVESRVSL